MFERQSALAGVLEHGGRDGAGGQRRLRLGEARGWRLVQAAAFPATAAEFVCAVQTGIGVGLPDRVGRAVTSGGRTVMRIGPEHFWIISNDGEDLMPRLQSIVAPAVGAATSLSHARTCIVIEGSAARDLLSGIALDFNPVHFPRDCFALTALHHNPVLIHRSGENRYDLYALRTFGLSTWEWLTDAALPLGYDVVQCRGRL